MRQQKVRFQPKRPNASRRLSAVVSLAVSLILWLSPFLTAPVAAAPPEPIREATSGITRESRTGTDRPLPAEKPRLPDQLVADIAPRHLRPGAEGTDVSGPSSPPRRRASDRTAAALGDNGSAMVLGMTRDELFDAFSRFVSARAEPRSAPKVVEDDAEAEGPDDDTAEAGVIADRGQPAAKVHAKAKPKKRR